MGVFVISKRKDDNYKFEFVSRKGKTILVSDCYELRFECEAEIESLKANIENVVFMKFRTSSGKFYFRLLLDKKELASSRKYTTQFLMKKGIDEILRTFSTSEVLDFSLNELVFPEIEF